MENTEEQVKQEPVSSVLEGQRRIVGSWMLDEFPELDNGPAPVRLLVIGKTGAGKSSTINSVFGTEIPTSVGDDVHKEISEYSLGHLTVVDTPGALDVGGDEQEFENRLRVKEYVETHEIDAVWFFGDIATAVTGSFLQSIKFYNKFLPKELWKKTVLVAPKAYVPGDTWDLVTGRGEKAAGMMRRMLSLGEKDLPLQFVENTIDSINKQLLEGGNFSDSCGSVVDGVAMLPSGESWLEGLLQKTIGVIGDQSKAFSLLSAV